MVTLVTGNLFQSKTQTLVNAINCRGVMGKGIALDFKVKYPLMFEDYAGRCARHEVKLGEPYVFKLHKGVWILNFPTKDHWRDDSHLPDIVKGLDYLEAHYKEWGIESMAVPALGCGKGRLNWKTVGPILYQHLNRFEIPVELYPPSGTAEAETVVDFLAKNGQ